MFNKHKWLARLGALVMLCTFNQASVFAQCDFVNDITGLSLTTAPTGDAANPLLYTQVYALVDYSGKIFRTSATPNFTGVDAGVYHLYALNYSNLEAAAVTPLLAVGESWSLVELYGSTVGNCLDYTASYGACPISVCDEMTVCEFDEVTKVASSFETTGHAQSYCLVCAGNVEAVNTTGVFDFASITAVTSGASCQIFAFNYNTLPTELSVGSTWAALSAAACAGCVDYMGVDLNINGVSQASGSGVSTTADWWNTSDGCAGAQQGVNNGGTVNRTVNNWCVPAYNVASISARVAVLNNGLQQLRQNNSSLGRSFACNGSMDLTQNPVFYTIECDPATASTLNVEVTNPGGAITKIEAALYGPVDASCPVLSGGSFVSCDDAGTGSISGDPMGDLDLTTSAAAGDVYILIVDTEGREQFTIEINDVVLSSKLLDFNGSKEESYNALVWETEEDQTTAYYILERSFDGFTYEGISNTIAAKNLQGINRYSFDDSEIRKGTAYYRLKIYDNTGNYEYSNIVALSRADKQMKYSVYPNPSKDVFYVEILANEAADVDYVVYDMLGAKVFAKSASLQMGMNRFEVDLSNLPSACYTLQLNSNNNTIYQKLIKD